MKRTFLFVSVAIAFLVAGLLAKAVADADDKPAAKSDKKAPEEKRVSRDTNGNVVLYIEIETQKRSGLKIESLPAAQMTPELKAYGRVLDPSSIAGLMNDAASAQAAYSASSNELARLQALSGSGNASARALQAAEAAALRDQLTLQSARDHLRLSWGREIADQTNLPAFIQSLTSIDTVLIRVDLPAGRRLTSPPGGARVAPLAGDPVEAQVLGAAMAVDPQTQGQGFVLQVKPNSPHFLPGEAVTGFLKSSGEPLNGVVVPRDAVVRADGAPWIYVASGEDHFIRKEISLDQPAENGWFVTNGVTADDRVVTLGAQALLSEELKSTSGPPDEEH